MGWQFDEHPRHEGFLRAFVRDSDGALHPLGRGLPGGDDEQVADVICVECSCGWRSSPFAPPLAMYFPFDVEVHVDVENMSRKIWEEHVQRGS